MKKSRLTKSFRKHYKQANTHYLKWSVRFTLLYVFTPDLRYVFLQKSPESQGFQKSWKLSLFLKNRHFFENLRKQNFWIDEALLRNRFFWIFEKCFLNCEFFEKATFLENFFEIDFWKSTKLFLKWKFFLNFFDFFEKIRTALFEKKIVKAFTLRMQNLKNKNSYAVIVLFELFWILC